MLLFILPAYSGEVLMLLACLSGANGVFAA